MKLIKKNSTFHIGPLKLKTNVFYCKKCKIIQRFTTDIKKVKCPICEEK